jgi:hypothetical protein
MPERSPREVLDDHLRLRAEGNVETDLARNYAPDVVVLCSYGALRGLDAMRKSAADLKEQLPNARFDYKVIAVEDEYGYLRWSAESNTCRVPDGADSYVIRNGRIVMQSISYRLEPGDHPAQDRAT